MSKLKNPVQMAVIGAAHGIRGEVRVKTFTGDPLALGDYGRRLYDEQGKTFEIAAIRPQGTVVVVRFKGIDDRNAAEALSGTALFVDRSALPEDLEEDEFYQADLVGLSVHDETGKSIGKVTAVQNFGGGDILVLSLVGGKEALIPFTRAAVPDIALDAGFIRIDPSAAGLIEEEEEVAPDAADETDISVRGGFDPKQRPRGPKQAGGNR
jgi:16S rRNA processing protein RimM